MAYYGLFAVAPLVALSMALATLVFDDAEVQQYLVDVIDEIFAEAQPVSTESLVSQLDETYTSTSYGLIGLATLVFAASLVFVAIQDAINSIWDLPVRRGFRHTVTKRLTAFLVVLGTAGLLIAGLVAQGLASLIDAILPGTTAERLVVTAGGTAAALAALTGALAVLYKLLGPDHVRWSSALLSAVLTAVAMTVGSVALGAYLAHFGRTSVSSVTAGLFFFLFWIYYQAQILLVGVHLVRVLDGDIPEGQTS